MVALQMEDAKPNKKFADVMRVTRVEYASTQTNNLSQF